jgi:hypothetical protein
MNEAGAGRIGKNETDAGEIGAGEICTNEMGTSERGTGVTETNETDMNEAATGVTGTSNIAAKGTAPGTAPGISSCAAILEQTDLLHMQLIQMIVMRRMTTLKLASGKTNLAKSESFGGASHQRQRSHWWRRHRQRV